MTFIVLTKDEAANIGPCLRSIPVDARRLVYDSGSTDGTQALAASLGAEVVTAPWNGFTAARQAAARLARTPWVFMLDADERISAALQTEMQGLQPADDVDAYSMPRRNVFCGRWVRGAGWWPDRLVRLFRRDRAVLQARPSGLHERWCAVGKCGRLHAPIEHHSYPDLAAYGRKFARYTDIEAAAQAPSPLRAVADWLLVPVRAAWLYVIRLGALDGWRGAFIALASAAYPAVSASKSLRRRNTVV